MPGLLPCGLGIRDRRPVSAVRSFQARSVPSTGPGIPGLQRALHRSWDVCLWDRPGLTLWVQVLISSRNTPLHPRQTHRMFVKCLGIGPVKLMSQAWCEHGQSWAGVDCPACSGLLPVGHGEKGLVDGPGGADRSPIPPLMERPCRELTGWQGGSSAGSGQDQLFLYISPKSKLQGRKPSAPNMFFVAVGFCCVWKC